MKGIMMFDNLNDLTFIDVDEELSMHIQNLALKDGLLEGNSFKDELSQVNKNVVMQLFSPLIASYKVMQAQFGNKYKFIESEDGVLLVFDDISNYVVINICPKEEKLADAQKELSVFVVIIEMLYGPSLHMMKSHISQSNGTNISRFNLISSILNKWKTLRMEQQMFLVEAVERLVVNQDITAMCINLLQDILEKLRNTQKTETFTHAFVLVDTKLLALYSSRNSGNLPKESLLLLILVVQAIRTKVPDEKMSQISEPATDEEEFFVPVSPTSKIEKKDKSRKSKSSKDVELQNYLKVGAHSVLLYLKSNSGNFVPHILYVTEITNKITIVTLIELSTYSSVSSHIQTCIKHLRNILCHPAVRPPLTPFKVFETEFKNLVDAMWKMKLISDKEKHIRRLVTKFEQLKQYNLKDFLKYSSDEIVDPILESGLSSCRDLINEVFEATIAIPCLKYEEKSTTNEHQEIFTVVQKLAVRQLCDVADFLEVKSVQNVTMASYIAKYPGLIHFIYVDRNSDCLIAPGVIVKKGRLNCATSLKQKVWKMVTFGRRYLDGVNNYCYSWKDEDLHYFYNIWFEDCMGKTIKPTFNPDMKHFPEKGIICGNFYRKLVEECFPGASHSNIMCYEFFCAYLSSTLIEVIVDNSRELCSQLWDFSGAYRASLDLL